MPRRASPS